MKKKIPKFDMKKWEEKQDVLAKQANDTPSSGPSVGSKWLEEQIQKYYKDRELPNEATSGEALHKRNLFGCLPVGTTTVGDPFDKYLFGGAVDTTDTWGWKTPYVTFDPAAGIQAPACCQRDDFINVGFHHDKFVCKVCNREKC